MKFQTLIFGLSMASVIVAGINPSWATPDKDSDYTIATLNSERVLVNELTGTPLNVRNRSIPAYTIAEAVPAQRIRFRQGATSATIKNAIVRGEPPKTYVLGAGKGQKMTLRITSLEKNAVLRLIAPNGTIIVNEAKGEKVLNNLPLAGDYTIEVGTERGNASYELYVSIVGSPRR
ncbi:MAG TPA: hypothetical protein V6D50_08765 [Chroococcales cyanobacterium]|jgi:hypothetical protein